MDLSFILPIVILGVFIWFFVQWNNQAAAHKVEQARLQKLADDARPVLFIRAEDLHNARMKEVSLKETDLLHRQQEAEFARAERQAERLARQAEADRTFEQRKQSEAHNAALQRIAAVSKLANDQRSVVLADLKIVKEGGTLPSLQVPLDLVAPVLIAEEALPGPEATELQQEVFDVTVGGNRIVLTYLPALKMGMYDGVVKRDFFECSKEQLVQDAIIKAMAA